MIHSVATVKPPTNNGQRRERRDRRRVAQRTGFTLTMKEKMVSSCSPARGFTVKQETKRRLVRMKKL